MNYGGCHYCYAGDEDLRVVQLSHDPGGGEETWQEPMRCCKRCRKHLNGQFRYAKKEQA